MDDRGGGAPSTELGAETEGLELVTDGYVRFTDVQYKWQTILNPWHRNAVGALIHISVLTAAEHPLRLPGEEGMTLYIGTDRQGKQRLLYSLRQLEYLQYYIHEMRLSDPGWIMSHSPKRTEPGSKVEDMLSAGGEWVPLPANIFRADHFVLIEPTLFASPPEFSKMVKQLSKQNKLLEKTRLLANPTSTMINREEAKIENATPGPGLRKGGTRRRSPNGRRKENGKDVNGDDEDENEGVETGWGGFPLKKAGVVKPSDLSSIDKDNRDQVSGNGTNHEPSLVADAPGKARQDGDKSRVDEMTTSGDLRASNAQKALDFCAFPRSQAYEASNPAKESASTTASGGANTPPTAPSENFTTNYYFHAQQAFLVASLGGLAGALEASPGESGPPPELGRSLFVALNITTWEDDADVILEVGWAAVWWQDRLGGVGEDGAGCEQIQDRGHLCRTTFSASGMVTGGRTTVISTSLPVAEVNLGKVMNRLLADLSKKSGGGPLYVLVHSPDASPSELGKLGLDTTSWERHLKPAGWEYASYAAAEGVGKIFVLDTAILFAAIEYDPTQLPAPTHTKRFLEEVASIMFGQDKDRAPVFCGNAGNDAFYNLEVFLAIVAGPPIEDLRLDFRRSRGLVDSKAEASNSEDEQDDNSHTQVVQTIPLTPVGDDESAIKATNHDSDREEPDSDGGMIKGVYFEDDEGNVIRVE